MVMTRGNICERRQFGVPTWHNRWQYISCIAILCIVVVTSGGSATAEPVRLRFWAVGGEAKLLEPIVASFSLENPDIRVSVQGQSWGNAYEKYVTSAVGGIGPDVAQIGTTWMTKMHGLHALLPLDDRLASVGLRPDAFFPGPLQTCRFDNRLYGLPWYVDTRLIFYMKDALKDVGYERFPETWDEFVELGHLINARKRQRGEPGYFVCYPLGTFEFLTLYWQSGGRIDLSDPSRPAWDERAFVEASECMLGLVRDGLTKMFDDTGRSYTTDFVSGYAPVWISGPWMAGDLVKKHPQDFDRWQTAPMPKRQTRTSFVGGSDLVIFRTTRYPEQSLRFLAYMMRPEVQAAFFEVSRDLPAVRAAWDLPALASDTHLHAFKQQLEDTCSPPVEPEWELIDEEFLRQLERVLRLVSTPREACSKLNDKAAEVLTRRKAKMSPWARLLVAAGLCVIPLAMVGFWIGAGRGRAAAWAGSWRGLTILAGFLGPAFMLILVFRLLPITAAFVTSLTDFDAYGLGDWRRVQFVGLENYARLFSDASFLASLRNTVVFIFIGTPLNILIALGLALTVEQFGSRWRQFLRLGFFLPTVVTAVAAALIFRWLLSAESPTGHLLAWLGIGPVQFLTDPTLSLPSLIAFAVWKGFGYNLVIFLAALQNVPRQLYEVVQVDGGGWWAQFWHVTIPSLRRTMFMVFVATVVTSSHFFVEPYMLTGGGPLDSSNSLMYYTYVQGFNRFNLGYASSVVYVLFFGFCVFNLWQRRVRAGLEE